MGINVAHYKTVTFGISAAYTGVAGALSPSPSPSWRPTASASTCRSILVGVVVGGIASLPGAVIGGIFVLVENSAQALSTFARTTSACRSTCRPGPCTASC